MIAYFRIKYMEPDEFTAAEQKDFIRNYVEHICKLSLVGFKYKKTLTTTIGKETVVSIKYNIKKSIDYDHLASIMENHEVLDELVIYIAF